MNLLDSDEIAQALGRVEAQPWVHPLLPQVEGHGHLLGRSKVRVNVIMCQGYVYLLEQVHGHDNIMKL